MIFQIRRAVAEDAAGAASVMCRSIEVLCVADHRNDKSLLQDWTGNKTEKEVLQWIQDPENWPAVAIEAGQVVGFAMLNEQGVLLLLYVLPKAVGQGVGAELLAAIESHGREAGLGKLQLESTLTARKFYKKHGFSDVKITADVAGELRCYPMEKQL